VDDLGYIKYVSFYKMSHIEVESIPEELIVDYSFDVSFSMDYLYVIFIIVCIVNLIKSLKI